MFSKDLLSFIQPLGAASSSGDVEKQAAQIASDLGFYFCSSVSRDVSDVLHPDIKVFHSYPSEWETIYHEKGYFFSDPANSKQTLEQPLYRWDSQGSSEVLDSARDFGIFNGVTCSLRDRHFICSISFAAGLNDLSDDMLVGAQFIAPYIANALIRTSTRPAADDALNPLSERERECLSWVSEGKTSWEISVILAISERTVLFHLSNVQKKLQTCSRAHSVAKATMLGLLDADLTTIDPFLDNTQP